MESVVIEIRPEEHDIDHNALQEILKRTWASDDMRLWSRNMSLCKAWATCKRGEWLLRLAAMLGISLKLLVMAACACARLVLVYVPEGENRPRHAIEMAEAWCRGEVDLEQVRLAAIDASYAFEDYVEDDGAAYAAFAAYCAACAAYDTPVAAAHAGCSAARAVRAREGADVGLHMLKQCADLVRQAIPYHAIAAAARQMLKGC